MTELNENQATDSYTEVIRAFPVGEAIDFGAVAQACNEFLDSPEAAGTEPKAGTTGE